MSIFNVGPDGILLVEALIISVLIAVLAWRRVGAAAGISATVIAVAAFGILQAMSASATPDLPHRIVSASFHIVPSALMLAASRQHWLARHAWALVLIGPFVFVGCYVGICEACLKAGVI
jgi:hypothetical protein